MNKNEKWISLQNKIYEFQNRVDKEFDAALLTMNSAVFFRSNYINRLKADVKSDATFRNEEIQETLERPCHVGYGDGIHTFHHQSTFAQIIKIAETPGEIENRIAGLLIVTIYQLWEQKYRRDIAELLGILKKDLQGDIWGELRWLRISILKKDYKAIKELEKCKLIRSFENEEVIILDTLILQTIMNEIHQWCDNCLIQKLLEKV